MFYDIESNSTDYVNNDDYVTEDDTDEYLITMTPEEKEDAKYLAIFQNNNEDFDEQIMGVDSKNELKKLEESMIERTDIGYHRCKI